MADADFAYQPPGQANAYGPKTRPGDDTGGAPIFSEDWNDEPDRQAAEKFLRDKAQGKR